MTNTVSEPQLGQILDRRKQLKRQRRLNFLRATWRTIIITGLTTTLGWVLTQSEWKIQQVSQVEFKGNQQISTQTLEQLLPLTYPTSLIQIQPQAIAQTLQDRAHIQKATVTRQLFPARLTVTVQERAPVAVTACDRCQLMTETASADHAKLSPANLWLIDAKGVALPLETYGELQQSGRLPQLSLQNFFQPPPQSAQTSAEAAQQSLDKEPFQPVVLNPDRQRQWQQIYPILRQSSVTVSALNWQQTDQLVLSTELGQVHLGTYGPQLTDQLRALERLRSLPGAVNVKQVAYIDLRDPERPVLEMRESQNKQSPTATDN